MFLVSSLASANLAQNTITPPAAQQSNLTNIASLPLSPLVNAPSLPLNPSKMEAIYSGLFEYSSHINQSIDHHGLTVFWNHSLISTAINASHPQHLANTHLADDGELSAFVANSLNDDYVAAISTDQRINEVPIPTAIWLFSSAIMLFGFARRSTV